jgi:hypothetical protein
MKSVHDLVSPLILATKNGNLSWERDERRHEKRFCAGLPNHFKIEVWEWWDPSSENDGITVSLRDEDENQIDVIEADKYHPEYDDLHNLFDIARRSANNVDFVITSLEDAISKLAKSKKDE